jgi:hypothetical protein
MLQSQFESCLSVQHTSQTVVSTNTSMLFVIQNCYSAKSLLQYYTIEGFNTTYTQIQEENLFLISFVSATSR